MDSELKKLLAEAAQCSREDLNSSNPFAETGFDNGKKRLGWARSNDFSSISNLLKRLLSLVEGKENFIFIGMGGSVNGIKPLLSLFENKKIFTLDNLDPAAIKDIASHIEDWSKTLVIPVSKSGTTKETQLLAHTLKEKLSSELNISVPENNLFWLSDPPSFTKLDSLGWQKVRKFPIQFDSEDDIGGRFSCPNTLIFALPLFLLLNKDFDSLGRIYNEFFSLRETISGLSLSQALRYKDKKDALFAPVTGSENNRSFFPWITQLFQESLGSKLENFCVKTIPDYRESGLSSVGLQMSIEDPVVLLMARMYFFQLFIAFFSALKRINFVSQNHVEKYKSRMRQLEEEEVNGIPSLDLDSLLNKVKAALRPEHRFIEIVLYWHAGLRTINELSRVFGENFKDKRNLVCIGSDWNHQSYQAAFGDKYTFYVLLTASSYDSRIKGIPSAKLSENVKTLKVISKATHLTLSDKSFLFSFSP
ncbi:MAG: hypothetical protein GF375_05165 [Candidatus Omnitrophica bacterium]|nr:hypothetical protein [Candidatus Omnitrophota bacterium]MBD3269382.1 hypothetical protein [Candidatus Omnitrophota bacterium]